MHTIEVVELIFRLWLIHAVFGLGLSSPIIFLGRRRAHWEWWESLAVILPFSAWLSLMFSGLSTGKSLANLGECIFISFAMPIAALIRVWIGGVKHQRGYSVGLIVLLCAVAAGTFFLTPPLPE